MNAARYSAACHEAGQAILAWSFGLQAGALRANDDGSGGTDITSKHDFLPIVDQLAICFAGHQGQALAGCQMFDRQSLSDHARVRVILIDNGIEEGPEAERLRRVAREQARAILEPHRDLLIEIANELMPSGQLSAERMAQLLAPARRQG